MSKTVMIKGQAFDEDEVEQALRECGKWPRKRFYLFERFLHADNLQTFILTPFKWFGNGPETVRLYEPWRGYFKNAGPECDEIKVLRDTTGFYVERLPTESPQDFGEEFRYCGLGVKE